MHIQHTFQWLHSKQVAEAPWLLFGLMWHPCHVDTTHQSHFGTQSCRWSVRGRGLATLAAWSGFILESMSVTNSGEICGLDWPPLAGCLPFPLSTLVGAGVIVMVTTQGWGHELLRGLELLPDLGGMTGVVEQLYWSGGTFQSFTGCFRHQLLTASLRGW